MATRLKDVINHRLRGVSTKYLQNYSNWFGQVEEIKSQPKGVKNIKKTLMRNNEAWDKFNHAENLYKKFIKECSERTYRCPTKRLRKTNISNLSARK